MRSRKRSALSEPASASVIGSFALGSMPAPDGRLIQTCHDVGVILGSVNRAACAGNPGVPVFDITDPEHPTFLYATTAPTVTGFHSLPSRGTARSWSPAGSPEAGPRRAARQRERRLGAGPSRQMR